MRSCVGRLRRSARGRTRDLGSGSQVTGLKVLGKSATADGVLTVVGNALNGCPLVRP